MKITQRDKRDEYKLFFHYSNISKHYSVRKKVLLYKENLSGMNEKLLNIDIDLCFGEDVINTFQIRAIHPLGIKLIPFTGKHGETFSCDLTWNKQMDGATKSQLFYQEIFDNLLAVGIAKCPPIPKMYYKIRK